MCVKYTFLTARPWAERGSYLIYPWFINRAAMGRAPFLIYPWFINRAAIGRARFLIYPWFIIFFFMSVSWTKLLTAKIPMTQLVLFINRAGI